MFSLVTAKSIKRIEDLKGKAVAVSNPLGIHAYVTLQILKKFGLDPGKDPRFLYLGEESAWVSAMETGLVSGAFIQPPTSLVLKAKRLQHYWSMPAITSSCLSPDCRHPWNACRRIQKK